MNKIDFHDVSIVFFSYDTIEGAPTLGSCLTLIFSLNIEVCEDRKYLGGVQGRSPEKKKTDIGI